MLKEQLSIKEDKEIISVSTDVMEKFKNGGGEKFKARFEIGETLLSQGLLPVHGCFTAEGVAIIGDSGTGKSYTAKEMGLNVISNDFALIDATGNLSKLDYEDLNVVRTNVDTPIHTTILLTNDMDDQRDVWHPSKEESLQIFQKSHTKHSFPVDEISKEQNLIEEFLKDKKVIAVNTARTKNSKNLPLILKQAYQQESDPLKINIMGLGRVSKELISQLIALDQNHSIGIFSKNNQRAKALSRDFNTATCLNDNLKSIQVIESEKDLLDADIIIITTSTSKAVAQVLVHQDQMEKNILERQIKKDPNEKLMQPLLDEINVNGFSGNIFMLTNPVEDLCEHMYQKSQDEHGKNRLLSNQIIGVGANLDKARAKLILKEKGLPFDQIKISGRHSGEIDVDNNENYDALLTQEVRNESKKLRQGLKDSGAPEYEQRTIYGPARAIVELVKGFNKNIDNVFSAQQKDGVFMAVEKPLACVS